MGSRSENLLAAEHEIFDVAIIGGGVNGACLFDRLRRSGHQVVLLEKGDFGGGTSQASAMMVWGGLLYLAGFDFRTVFSLSNSRDRMIREMPEWVSPKKIGILPASRGVLGKHSVLLGLHLYWLIGRLNRRRATLERDFLGKSLLTRDVDALAYEEGFLRQSDARFVLHWLLGHFPPFGVPLNYLEVIGGEYQRTDKLWHLMAKDLIGGHELTIRARAIANCAGVWTDQVNANSRIRSPIKHIFSKGVFLGLNRNEDQEMPLIFDMGEHDDVICSIPWGPVELWGPTETKIESLETGFEASPEDVCFLLDQRERHFKAAASKEDIVSLRSGVRPLAVEASYDRAEYPLALSRRPQIVADSEVPWISVYGGKITNCEDIANSSAERLTSMLPAPSPPVENIAAFKVGDVRMSKFPGVDEAVPEIDWCNKQEFCCTIEDYLRRRTNIAQWVPREGLGRTNENDALLLDLCLQLTDGNKAAAEQQLAEYHTGVVRRFDRVLSSL